ncbi:tyrosine-type recombinase/integrase [Thiorhodovibrio frisius]|uniref:Phage integrase family protein n=1 Tax=Thiorhodovibrio frisius TaxID=631362 RepID=H8YW01_9GAMM|nr:integrase family protein [Thiorhodovibrio frisius]EIC23792.1 phage integrase family protein [Thiorhodovibrio frisius]WPL23199.1 hypothetical protein Thiofri_03382 [Thiorhodovibrio frisius]
MVTVKALRTLKPGVWLSDGGARGAGTLVFRKTGGVTRAYFRYTQSDGSRYAFPLGHCDENGRDGLSLADARTKASELSKLYLSGIRDIRGYLENQEAARRAEQEAEKSAAIAAEVANQAKKVQTLRALCEAYTTALESQGKMKSARDVRSAFKVHVFQNHASLADLPASDVTPQQIAMIVRSVREAGKERTAGILRSYLRAAYAMAIRAPFDSAVNSQLAAFDVEMNPVDAIPTIPVRSGQRSLSHTEFRDYLNNLNDSIPDMALKLAVVSGGQRMAQLLRVRVADYNEATQVLRLWDGKGKRREPREHLIPLGPKGEAIVTGLVARAREKTKEFAAINETLAESNPSLWISTGGATVVETTPGKRLIEISSAMQVEPFNLRDVRRTVETMLASMGISRETRAQLLSHGLGGVQAVHYDRHTYMEEKRAAILAWESQLLEIGVNL